MGRNHQDRLSHRRGHRDSPIAWAGDACPISFAQASGCGPGRYLTLRWYAPRLNAAREPAKVMSMKPNVPGLLAFVYGLTGLGAWAETPLPAPFPEARYQQMSAKSPFAVATTAFVPTAAPAPGFAAQLYVDGVAHVGKTDFVAIKSRDPDKPAAIFLEVGKSTIDGMKVERVLWSDEMGRSTVEVSKAGEKATLLFDEQQMAQNAGASQQLAPGQPGFLLPRQRGPAGSPTSAGFQQPGRQFDRPPLPQRVIEAYRRRGIQAGQ